MQNVVITGGTGYIGGRLARFLAGHGHSVTVTSTHPPDSSFRSLLSDVDFAVLDLENEIIGDLFAGADSVIHLAAMNELECKADPEKAARINTLGTVKVVEAAIRDGVRQFLYFSTVHVYGSPLSGRMDESVIPEPVHPYAVTKKAAEEFVLAAGRTKQIDGIVLRLSNAFGAPLNPEINRWTLLVNDLCRQVFSTGKLILKSSGSQERDFICMTDVMRVVEFFLHSPPARHTGLFDLGGGHSLTILEMTELIAGRFQSVFGRKPEIIKQETDNNGHMPLIFSIDNLLRTGFVLNGDFEREIDEMLLFCQKHFS